MHSNSRRHMLRVLVITAALLLGGSAQEGSGYAAEPLRAVQGEYQVKAAFVYNFIKFVEWPAENASEDNELRLCVMGTLPALAPFEDLHGREIMGKRLYVLQVSEWEAVDPCQVLFVASSLSTRMRSVVAAVANKPILTIGDTDGYARQGIMINMYLERKRVRFEINAHAARKVGLQISAKLLSLAGTVYDNARGED